MSRRADLVGESLARLMSLRRPWRTKSIETTSPTTGDPPRSSAGNRYVTTRFGVDVVLTDFDRSTEPSAQESGDDLQAVSSLGLTIRVPGRTSLLGHLDVGPSRAIGHPIITCPYRLGSASLTVIRMASRPMQASRPASRAGSGQKHLFWQLFT